jgi:ABC-type Fe3+ transport system permease subunit
VIKRWAVFLVSAAITCVFIINFCALIYACGCRSFWAGAAEDCNIHDHEAHHCPWCSIGTGGFVAVASGIVALQAALSFGPHPWGIAARFLASLIAFPVAGSVIAIALGLWQGYWK